MAASALQLNAFQINSFSTGVQEAEPQDLDKGGDTNQMVKVFLGHSLGWVNTFVNPVRTISSTGIYMVNPGNKIILVNTSDSVTLMLPLAFAWLNQPVYRPATAFDRSIMVRNSGNNPGDITIYPFGTDEIDDTSNPVSINIGTITFFPIPTGWFTEARFPAQEDNVGFLWDGNILWDEFGLVWQ